MSSRSSPIRRAAAHPPRCSERASAEALPRSVGTGKGVSLVRGASAEGTLRITARSVLGSQVAPRSAASPLWSGGPAGRALDLQPHRRLRYAKRPALPAPSGELGPTGDGSASIRPLSWDRNALPSRAAPTDAPSAPTPHRASTQASTSSAGRRTTGIRAMVRRSGAERKPRKGRSGPAAAPSWRSAGARGQRPLRWLR